MVQVPCADVLVLRSQAVAVRLAMEKQTQRQESLRAHSCASCLRGTPEPPEGPSSQSVQQQLPSPPSPPTVLTSYGGFLLMVNGSGPCNPLI